jgi:hypothetical protein
MPLLGMGPRGLIWTFGRHWKSEVKMANNAMMLNGARPEVYLDSQGIPWQWNQTGPDAPATGASERENKNDWQT